MSAGLEVKIYRLSGVCVLLTLAALFLPRFISNPEGGFASGSSAILALIGLLAVALLFSIYLLMITVRHFKILSGKPRLAGLLPCLLLSIVLFGLLGFLTY